MRTSNRAVCWCRFQEKASNELALYLSFQLVLCSGSKPQRRFPQCLKMSCNWFITGPGPPTPSPPHCTAPFEAQELIVMCWWLVVAVAYFGSRTNLIILPQASHKPHKPTLPNLTLPLVLSCISGQLHVFHCSAVYLFFITQQAHKIGSVWAVGWTLQSKNCKREESNAA